MQIGSDHTLTIENIKNNETICYNLLLLNGFIETKTNHKCEHSKIIVQIEHENNLNYQFDVVKSHFKCLLNLKPGTNNFILKYCDTSLALTINFQLRPTKYKILPLYIICKNHNGNFQTANNLDNSPEVACRKIITVARLMQTFYAEKLSELGFSRNTFQFLHLDEDLNPICEIFQSDLDYKHAVKMSPSQLWEYFGREILKSSKFDTKVKYLAFLSCTTYNGVKFKKDSHKTHEDLIKLTDAYVALGGGGLALFHSACFYSWPNNVETCIESFLDHTVINKSILLDDSAYRGTYGACLSTTLGAVCHEIGHCFDLGHTKTGLMARGFDNIRRVFYISKQNYFDKDLSKNQNTFPRSVIINGKDTYYDLTYFEKNCGIILNSHKWFISNSDSNEDGKIYIDKIHKEVRSSAPLRLVEIRENNTELVITWWEFSLQHPKKSFFIPLYHICKPNTIIFAIDCYGNSVKDTLQCKYKE